MSDAPAELALRVRVLVPPAPFALAARNRRCCAAQVETAQAEARRHHPGARRHRQLGFEIDQCGAPAAFEIDGQPLCERHAGKKALEILIAQEIGPMLDAALASKRGQR